jgi:hypothetical protein
MIDINDWIDTYCKRWREQAVASVRDGMPLPPLTPLEDFMEELGIMQADLDALPDDDAEEN